MQRIKKAVSDSVSTIAVAIPSVGTEGSGGYFTGGDPGNGIPATKLNYDFFNDTQEEICNVVTEVGGVSLADGSRGQMATALGGARGIKAHATDTGSVTTLNTRVVIASSTSKAAGNGANIAMGTLDAEVYGSRTAIIASQASSGNCEIGNTAVNSALLATDDSTAAGSQTAVVASDHCLVSICSNSLAAASTLTDVAGSSHESAAIASSGSTITDGAHAGMLATQTCTISAGTNVAVVASLNVASTSGANAAAVASSGGTADGINAAVVASFGSGADGAEAMTAASYNAQTDGDLSASIACHNTNIGASRDHAMLVASKNCELGTSYALALGYHASTTPTFSDSNQNLTFKVDGTTGDIYTDGTAGAGAADFAECFENLTTEVIPAGSLVAREGRKVRLALPGDRVAGVVSAEPMMLGNSGQSWAGRYERDEFGGKVMESHDYVKWSDLYEDRTVTEMVTETRKVESAIVAVNGAPLFVDEPYQVERSKVVKVKTRDGFNGLVAELADDAVIPSDATYSTVKAPKPSEAYDPSREHVSRGARPTEWTSVALMGQVRVRVDVGVDVGDFLAPGTNGRAVATKKPNGRPVEVMEITSPYDSQKGYGVALCLVG